MVKYAKALKTPDPKNQVSHIHQRSVAADLMGVEVSLNKMGHRGPDIDFSLPDQKILVLGSSITLGWGVDEANTFTATLENLLNSSNQKKTRVINAGIGNYNSYYQMQLLKDQIATVGPDLVVLQYFLNDAEPNPVQKNSLLLQNSLFLAFLYDKFAAIQYRLSGGGTLEDHYEKIYTDNSPSWQRAQNDLLAMKEMTEKHSAKFVVMLVPEFFNLDPKGPFKGFHNQIKQTLQGLNIHTIDTYDTFSKRFFKKEKEVWVSDTDRHPNKEGHRIMAQFMFEHLAFDNQKSLSVLK